jgi:hypothetical protein
LDVCELKAEMDAHEAEIWTENASLRALCTQIADEYPKSNKGVFMPLKPKFPLFSLLNQEI